MAIVPVPGVNPAGPYSTVNVPPVIGLVQVNVAPLEVIGAALKLVGEGHEVGAYLKVKPEAGNNVVDTPHVEVLAVPFIDVAHVLVPVTTERFLILVG